MKSVFVLSMGDMNGIGPEVLLKSLTESVRKQHRFVITGQISVLSWWNTHLQLDIPLIALLQPDEFLPDGTVGVWASGGQSEYIPDPGNISETAGKLAIDAIRDGTTLCLRQIAAALITAPISKEAVSLAGLNHPGHTEFLAELSGTDVHDIMMMLCSDQLRVGLCTIHEPLHRVSSMITSENILHQLRILQKALQQQFHIDDPLIDVLGLNPHAGDGGVIGNEEIQHIIPALESAEKEGIRTRGPFPADGYFAGTMRQSADAILAMYHDQGLIPFKMLAFETGVNTTIGLPFIRTSPDHGTAFDISGKNIADPSSFRHALDLAIRLGSV